MKPPLVRRTRLLLLACGLVAVVIMLRFFEQRQVYHPSRSFDTTGAELGRPYEQVHFQSGDGVELHGWFYPAATNSPNAHIGLVYCHGNAGNISHRLDTCQALLQTGIAVFLFDYRGYGRSAGSPSEEGTYLDAQAACAWLRQKGFASTNLIAYGESLGGGIATEIMLREHLGGLVLEGTFTSVPDIGAELLPWLPVRWLARIKYDTLSKLPHVTAPVLVMHSRSDEMIGFHHSQKNYAAIQSPKSFCELDGDHNSPLKDRKAFVGGIQGLLTMMATNPAASSLPGHQ
jgi:fermentation-respiration switch protein FrsA (DUF1100 family)